VDFTQAGYLWMATAPEHLRVFEANAALQRRHGLQIELLGPRGRGRKAPYVGATTCWAASSTAATAMRRRPTT
jgi:hypothetical protein